MHHVGILRNNARFVLPIIVIVMLLPSCTSKNKVTQLSPTSPQNSATSVTNNQTMEPATNTTNTIDIEQAKKNEKFLTRIASAEHKSRMANFDVVLILVEIARAGNDYEIIGDHDSYIDAALISKPYRDKWWSTKALILISDKKGNLLTTIIRPLPTSFTAEGIPSAVLGDKGTVLVSWNANTLLGQRVYLEVDLPIINNLCISYEIEEKQAALNKAYAQAKEKALTDAKSGLPYVEPQKEDYILDSEQTAEIANKYIDIQAVLYIQ